MVSFQRIDRSMWRGSATRLAVAVGIGALVLSACSAGADAESDDSGLQTVTLAMDYLPNAMHGGLAYAMQEGLFADQGIKVKLISYNGSTGGSTVVASGKADLAIGENAAFDIGYFATGAPMRSIFIISPGNPTYLSVLKSSGITSPAQLAGKAHGGFGSPLEDEIVNQMIETDGGKDKIKQVVLNVGTYEALKAGQVDSTVTYPDGELQFANEGIDLVRFKQSDYGVPKQVMAVSTVLADNDFLEDHPDLARGFTTALQQGYEKAIEDPAAVTASVLAQFPDANLDEAITLNSAKVYAETSFPNSDGPVGTQSVEKTQVAADWMAGRGLLVDPDGKLLSSFDVSPYITNEYLPAVVAN
ncbi:ABC transporter substrate-binding protein [Rhodococcus erythropolis]|uniref:ABC transporter substrate-binding protein n=1 Tax=Rhodococcus erythropolis TaxID=1833 RepID=UPI0024B7B087|nr:ABC transporter substrate-binding protein [Rhodococcus erythropolis]MDJ0012230.1 ABC transporter substrate-binding protein [Rhodococcus erythropolis]